MSHTPKCLIFGIDGGTFDIIEPLIERGRLPALAAVMKDSARARTECTWPPHTAPGWASFVTAGPPGHHAVYQFFDTQDREYRARIVGSGDFGCASAWDWLAAAGWTLGLVNVPMSHPQRKLPGYQITWPLSNTLRYCEPPSLLGELAQAGAHFQSDLATMYRGESDYIDQALQNVDARVRSLAHLLRHHPVDAVMVVLTEVDRVCHHYWHYSDPSHPAYVEGPSSYATAIERVYEAVDRALAKTLALLPDDCAVVVVSDHGFGPGHDAFAVHRYFEDAGWLATKPSGDSNGAPLGSWFSEDGREVDWARTRLYMPVPGSYGINVNLRSRQRHGSVAPQDFESVLDEATVRLGEVRLPSTGGPAFAKVLRREEAFAGPWTSKSPDLLLMPADESLMVQTSLSGPVWSRSYQTGLHRFEGMWMHRSPRVHAGRVTERVRLIDLMPTLLADLGVQPAASTPGRVIGSVFGAGAGTASACSIRAQAGPGDVDADGVELETEALTTRFKQMGYL